MEFCLNYLYGTNQDNVICINLANIALAESRNRDLTLLCNTNINKTYREEIYTNNYGKLKHIKSQNTKCSKNHRSVIIIVLGWRQRS